MSESNAFPVVGTDYGLEKSKAQEIQDAFMPMVTAMSALGPLFDELMAEVPEGPPSEEHIAKAKDLLKKYVKVRTGTATAHKEQKKPFYEAGKFIDVLKNSQKEASDHYEGALREIVDYAVFQETYRLNTLQIERVETIREYTGELKVHPDYSGMPEPVWQAYLSTAKDAFENPVVNLTDHQVVCFAAEYAYSMANLPKGEKQVEVFKEPPSMVYEQFERALKRWKKQQSHE